MGFLQDLNEEQISEVLLEAASRHTPMILTVRQSQAWLSLRSRFLAIRDAHLLVEPPQPQNGAPFYRFSPAEVVGVSMKFRHHKHIFSTTVIRSETLPISDDSEVPVVRLGCPGSMQRIQRRAFYRAKVPPGRVVRVSFWIGGLDSEPAVATPERLIWSGRLTDISAGGFQARVSNDVAEAIESGDFVGLRISFGQGEQPVYANAHFRHAVRANKEFLLGFQFIGMEQTPEGKESMRHIASRASEYQRVVLSVGASGDGEVESDDLAGTLPPQGPRPS